MTIKEFVEELKKFDQELEVMIADSEWGTESLNGMKEGIIHRWTIKGERYEVKALILS